MGRSRLGAQRGEQSLRSRRHLRYGCSQARVHRGWTRQGYLVAGFNGWRLDQCVSVVEQTLILALHSQHERLIDIAADGGKGWL